MRNHRQTIGLAIPAWRAAPFIAETIDSALAQIDVDVTVAVGIDGDDNGTAAACAPYAGDPRVRIVVRPRRLGWVDNTSATLRDALSAGVAFAAVLPHDDLIEPTYLSTLLGVHASRRAAAVYSDIVCFGGTDSIVRQESVEGSAVERQETLLRRHYGAVAYRGLCPAETLEAALPLSGNAARDFAADTVWVARLARYGDLVRVPELLYRKRIHPGNTHASWAEWSHARQVTAWIAHCFDMFAEARSVAHNGQDWIRLRDAAADRLWWIERRLGGLTSGQARRVRAAVKTLRAAEPSWAARFAWRLRRHLGSVGG